MVQIIDTEINKLIEQSNAIASNVTLENWEDVNILAKKRQNNLEQFFNSDIKAENAQKVEKMIRKILSIDNKLFQSIEVEQQKLLQRFSTLKINTKANSTYQKVASLK